MYCHHDGMALRVPEGGKAVGALPHDGPTGFWKRMSRGLVRVASWVNPFH